MMGKGASGTYSKIVDEKAHNDLWNYIRKSFLTRSLSHSINEYRGAVTFTMS